MHILDLTLPDPAANLACDEGLLDWFEDKGGDGVLRFWEPREYFVVVGYGNHVAKEVNVPACEASGIPILRRCSGGGTVLQGPGCLNYSLVLRIDEGGPLKSITLANKFIMERNRKALLYLGRDQRLLTSSSAKAAEDRSSPTVEVCGHTDLALVTQGPAGGTSLKFSGNAQRRKKNFLLFHGTYLMQFDIGLIEKYLRTPSKEPDYRKGRSHKEFLTNLDSPVDMVKHALREEWKAEDLMDAVPHDGIELLARDKYVTKEWNFKF